MENSKVLVVTFTEDERGLERSFDNKGFSPIEMLGLLEAAKACVFEAGFGEPYDIENEEVLPD